MEVENMVRTRLVGGALVAMLACLVVITLHAQGPGVLQQRAIPALAAEPPMLGIHWARGESGPAGQAAGANPNMTLHSGAIMPTTFVQAIFWGPSWSNTNWSYKISGMDLFYSTIGGSPYAGTANEYYGSDHSYVTSNITFGGEYTDLSSVPKTVSKITTPTFNEVCKLIGSHAVANGYYPVYVDQKRGSAGFCAYHSYGTCNNVPVQFAFFFNLDGDAGCDPQDTVTGHPQGLAALANVSGHEISEARTDPRNGGWYDNSGAENSDKCAWTFGSPDLTFSNGSSWKVQGNWSNNAYNNSAGYPNGNGQKGCIDGTSY
jgi:hypothetical protein